MAFHFLASLLQLTCAALLVLTPPSSAFMPTTYTISHKEISRSQAVTLTAPPLYSNKDPDFDNQNNGAVASGGSGSNEKEEKQQLREINLLSKQMDQKETAINRLKFQLNELKNAAQESEMRREEAEKQVDELTKASQVIKKKTENQYSKLQNLFRYVVYF